jgi:hypothetical protein
MGFLHKLLRVKWWQKLNNIEVAARCDIEHIPTMLSKIRMRWVGHMIRMENTRLPRKIPFWGIGKGRDEGAGEAETKHGHVI